MFKFNGSAIEDFAIKIFELELIIVNLCLGR
jgi:hypothetical protein